MKNLLIYLNPNKFDEESKKLIEIQIDNSLEFWSLQDTLLVTNFPYEYHGVKALVVESGLFCEINKKTSKINAIIYLLENNILNDLTWFHDLDAFQIYPIEVKLEQDIGFTDYGYSRKWNTGSIFFKPSSLDVFSWIKGSVYEHNTDEERALRILTRSNFNNINSRYKRMNITYNLGMRHLEYNLSIADKPIKVVHFHPNRSGLTDMFKPILTGRLNELINEKFTDLPKS